MDTEDWGEIYIGCAGGVDVVAQRAVAVEAVPIGLQGFEIALTGLRGGHSGVDIHLERGNAIRLLTRVVAQLCHDLDARLAGFNGGTLRNALPREAFATLVVPAEQVPRLKDALAQWQTLLRSELLGVDPDVTLHLQAALATKVLAPNEQKTLLALLLAAPHGVMRWSQRVPGVVETSNNLGVLSLSEQGIRIDFLVRSLVDSGTHECAQTIEAVCQLAGASTTRQGAYPGWAPNPDSPLLGLLQHVYRANFDIDPEIKVIHAGLECGVLGSKYPQLDMVSFGPTIRGAHSPDERVEIASVANFWRLLQALLQAVPAR